MPPKEAGRTPITVYGIRFSRIVEPTIPGSRPKRRSQRSSPITVTAAPGGASSAPVKVRPRIGSTPRRSK